VRAREANERKSMMTTQPTDPLATDPPPDDPRLALIRALNTPPYDLAAGKTGTPLGEAAQLLDAYRAAVLRDFLWRQEQSSGDEVAAKLVEDNRDLAELLHATEPTT
jgi:hypothetical protein